jgi:hypothetical protein
MISDIDDDESEGMGQSFMQKRSAFKESSDRRARAELRKIKVIGGKRCRSRCCSLQFSCGCLFRLLLLPSLTTIEGLRRPRLS